MLFRTINHYESESDEKIEEIIEETKEIIEETKEIIEETKEKRECFICFDFQSNNDNNIIRLKNYTDFYKFCECDGYIHVNCLNSWYKKNEECPICRNKVKRADTLEIYNLYQYQYGVYMIYSFLFIKRRFINSLMFFIKLTHRMFLVLFLFIIFNMINELYKNIIYELEKEMYDIYLLDNYGEPILNKSCSFSIN
jgi:hypothetical protein